MYKMDGRIRYSEVGCDGTLSLVGLVNYFQDCTTFHSEDAGLGVEVMMNRNRVWLLSGWQIVIDRLPKLNERVVVSTWPYAFRGFMGLRNNELTDAEGRRLAVANAVWTLVDMEKRSPVRITDRETAGYEIGEKADMEYAPRKIRPQGEGEEQEAVVIARERIDTNGHMNNGQYVGLAAEFLPEGVKVRQIRVEYKQEVRCHDVLVPVLYGGEGRMTVELRRDGQDCAVVELAW